MDATPRKALDMKTETETRTKIASILRDGIHFSGQTDSYVVHGAIDNILKLIDEHSRARAESFAEWTVATGCDRNWHKESSNYEKWRYGLVHLTTSELFDEFIKDTGKGKT